MNHRPRHGLAAVTFGFFLALAAPAQIPDVTKLLETMEASHAFPPECAMTASSVSTTTWRGAPESTYREHVGSFKDVWTASSIGEGYGAEVRYQTLTGEERWRAVVSGGEQRRFTYDMSGDSAAVTGELSVWRGREEAWVSPIAQYLDRNFMAPTLSGRRGPSYGVAEKMVDVDGHACYLVQIYWNRRTMDLWLDPAFDCLPRRYLMRNDFWRGQDPRSSRNRTASVTGLRFTMPPALEDAAGRTTAYEERMDQIELATFNGHPYIARARFEKELIFENNMAHVERLEYAVDSIGPVDEAVAAPFIAFVGLTKNGDRVKVYEPENEGTYVNMIWQDGQLVKAPFSLGNIASSVGQSYRRITANFSTESLRELDIRVVVGLCAILAIGINGVIMWVSHRKRRAAAGADAEARERDDVPVAE